MKTEKKYASVFELNGVPKLTQAFPLALQHVVAMIVGCVTPAIVIAEMAGLNEGDKVIFVQAASVSYTHLDVYKRQAAFFVFASGCICFISIRSAAACKRSGSHRKAENRSDQFLLHNQVLL